MEKIFSIILFSGLLFLYAPAFGNTYIERFILGHTVKVIQYDVSSEHYELEIGVTDDDTDVRSLMGSYGGVTAINGVFLCPDDYTACGDKSYTINERYAKGERIATYKSTGDRVVFGFDKASIPLLFQTDKINPESEGNIYQGFANFPLLMRDGDSTIESYHDLGLIDTKMLSNRTRNFICNDKEKETIYFGLISDISIDKVPAILERLGCSDALNLDAGGSTAFIYNGAYVAGPGRNILDGIVIKRKGFNSQKVEEKSEELANKIVRIISEKSLESQINILKSLHSSLRDIRTNIYDVFTTDTINQWNVNIGYEIEINDVKVLERIYLINALQYHLNEIRKDKTNQLLDIQNFLKDLDTPRETEL